MYAQLPPVFGQARQATLTETVIRYLSPVNILWQTGNTQALYIRNAQRLLKPGNGQADLANRDMCVLKSWASGPTPWLTECVLGIEVLTPGCIRSGILNLSDAYIFFKKASAGHMPVLHKPVVFAKGRCTV